MLSSMVTNGGKQRATGGGAVLGRARQRRAARAGRRPRAGAPDLRPRRPGLGSARNCAAARRLLAVAALRRRRASRWSTLTVDMRDVYPAAPLGGPRRSAGLRHAGRGRLPRRPQHRAAREGVGLSGARAGCRGCCSDRSPAIRFPMPRPSSSPRWRTRCRWGSAAPIAIETPLATMHKADVIRLGARSACRSS